MSHPTIISKRAPDQGQRTPELQAPGSKEWKGHTVTKRKSCFMVVFVKWVFVTIYRVGKAIVTFPVKVFSRKAKPIEVKKPEPPKPEEIKPEEKPPEPEKKPHIELSEDEKRIRAEKATEEQKKLEEAKKLEDEQKAKATAAALKEEETKRIAAEKAAEEKKKLEEAKKLEDEQKAKAAAAALKEEETKRIAAEKAAEEQKRLDEAKRLAEEAAKAHTGTQGPAANAPPVAAQAAAASGISKPEEKQIAAEQAAEQQKKAEEQKKLEEAKKLEDEQKAKATAAALKEEEEKQIAAEQAAEEQRQKAEEQRQITEALSLAEEAANALNGTQDSATTIPPVAAQAAAVSEISKPIVGPTTKETETSVVVSPPHTSPVSPRKDTNVPKNLHDIFTPPKLRSPTSPAPAAPAVAPKAEEFNPAGGFNLSALQKDLLAKADLVQEREDALRMNKPPKKKQPAQEQKKTEQLKEVAKILAQYSENNDQSPPAGIPDDLNSLVGENTFSKALGELASQNIAPEQKSASDDTESPFLTTIHVPVGLTADPAADSDQKSETKPGIKSDEKDKIKPHERGRKQKRGENVKELFDKSSSASTSPSLESRKTPLSSPPAERAEVQAANDAEETKAPGSPRASENSSTAASTTQDLPRLFSSLPKTENNLTKYARPVPHRDKTLSRNTGYSLRNQLNQQAERMTQSDFLDIAQVQRANEEAAPTPHSPPPSASDKPKTPHRLATSTPLAGLSALGIEAMGVKLKASPKSAPPKKTNSTQPSSPTPPKLKPVPKGEPTPATRNPDEQVLPSTGATSTADSSTNNFGVLSSLFTKGKNLFTGKK